MREEKEEGRTIWINSPPVHLTTTTTTTTTKLARQDAGLTGFASTFNLIQCFCVFRCLMGSGATSLCPRFVLNTASSPSLLFGAILWSNYGNVGTLGSPIMSPALTLIKISPSATFPLRPLHLVRLWPAPNATAPWTRSTYMEMGALMAFLSCSFPLFSPLVWVSGPSKQTDVCRTAGGEGGKTETLPKEGAVLFLFQKQLGWNFHLKE